MTYYQLDPRPQGAVANDAIFRQDCGACCHSSGMVDGFICPKCQGSGYAPVLGIEVTLPKYAERCDLRNLDHHGPGTTSETPSACEQALTASLPHEGTVLVTVRPDADSVTAMAVILLRQKKLPINHKLVDEIGKFDRLGPSACGELSDEVVAICRVAGDFKRTLEDRVAWAADVLTGKGDLAEIKALADESRAEMEVARAVSEVTVHRTIWCTNCNFSETFGNPTSETSCHRCGGCDTHDLSMIALVVSTHRGATAIGYESAPIVVAMNPEFPLDPRDPSAGTGRKFTVCRYDDHVPVDFAGIEQALNALEPGWGGRDTIIGSPQGKGSTLELETVTDIVARHLG